MLSRRSLLVLTILAVITAGSSILYLSHIAATSDTADAKSYPAPTQSVAFDNATLAQNIVDHGVFSRATTSPYTPDAWRTPGFPIVVAPFYALFHTFYSALVLQVFLLIFTVFLLFAMAKRLLGERLAFILCVLYLILPDTLLSASSLLNEMPFTFLFMSALYVFFFSRMRSEYLKWACTGFLLALATYVRPTSLYILVFFIPAYFFLYLPWSEITRKHFLGAMLMILVFLGTLLPWCLRNQRELGVLSFTSVGSFFLFRQNAAQFYASMHPGGDEAARYALENMAGIPRGPVPFDLKYSAAMQKVAIEIITAHPFRYALFHATTFIPFFTSSGAHDYWRFVHDMLPVPPPEAEPSLLQALHPFSWPTLVTVIQNHGWTLIENALWGFVTLLVLIGLWRSKDRRLAWMFFAIILYFAVVTGPGAHARYRVPVEPLLLISAFSAAAYLWEMRKNARLTK